MIPTRANLATLAQGTYQDRRAVRADRGATPEPVTAPHLPAPGSFACLRAAWLAHAALCIEHCGHERRARWAAQREGIHVCDGCLEPLDDRTVDLCLGCSPVHCRECGEEITEHDYLADGLCPECSALRAEPDEDWGRDER